MHRFIYDSSLTNPCEMLYLLVFVSMNKSKTQCQFLDVGRDVVSRETLKGLLRRATASIRVS